MRRAACAVLFLALARIATPSPGDCTLEVRVREGGAGPLDGVAVSVDSDLLFEPRTATTDGEGEAVIAALPAGGHRLEVSRPGYQWYEVETVNCVPTAVVRIHVDLERVEGDEVIFLPSGPTVDVESVEVVRLFSKRACAMLPEEGAGEDAAAGSNDDRTAVPDEAVAFSGEIVSASSGPGTTRSVSFPVVPGRRAMGAVSLDAGFGAGAKVGPTRESAATLESVGRLRASLGGPSSDGRTWSFGALEAQRSEWRDDVLFGGAAAGETARRDRRRESAGLVSVSVRRQLGPSDEIGIRAGAAASDIDGKAATLHVVPDSGLSIFDREQRAFEVGLRWSKVASGSSVFALDGRSIRWKDSIGQRDSGQMVRDQSADGFSSQGYGNGIWSGSGGLRSTDERVSDLEIGGRAEILAAGGHRVVADLRWGRRDREVRFPVMSCCGAGPLRPPGRLYRGSRDEVRIDTQMGDSTRGTTSEWRIDLHDSWRVGADVTLVFGLETRRSDFDAGPGRNGYLFDFEDTVAPRLGLVWDFEGNGRSRAWVHLERSRPGLSDAVHLRLAGALDVQTLIVGGNGEILLRPAGPVGVAANLEPATLDRATVGLEYEVLSDLVVGAAGVRQRLEHGVAALSTDGGWTFEVGPAVGGEWSEDLAWEQTQALLWLRKRLSNGWQAEWLVGWSRLVGAWPGAEAVDLADVDREGLRDVVVPAALENSFGYLPGDRRWKTEILGSWTFERGPVLGGRIAYSTGAPLSRLGALGDGFGLDRRFVGTRGSAGRSPGTWRADVVLTWPFDLASGTLEARFEALNLLDFDRGIRLDERWSLLDEDEAAGLSIDEQHTAGTWGSSLERQAPLQIRLGLGYSW